MIELQVILLYVNPIALRTAKTPYSKTLSAVGLRLNLSLLLHEVEGYQLRDNPNNK